MTIMAWKTTLNKTGIRVKCASMIVYVNDNLD